jgi:hypothetical protein
MSSPVRSEVGLDNALSYAPQWARRSRSAAVRLPASTAAPPTAPAIEDTPPISAAPGATLGVTESPPMAPGLGGPNVELPARLRPFEGDIAIKDLRRRLMLDPDLLLQPPMRAQVRDVIPWVWRLSCVFVLAATVAFAATLMVVSRGPRPPVVAPAADRLARPPLPPARLVVESQRGFANEPMPLGVSLADGSGNEMVTLVGLAPGTELTAGTPIGAGSWQLSARDLDNTLARPPKDFVGVMGAAIDLRSPGDRLMDSQLVRLEWVARKEARLPPRIDPPKPAAVPTQPLDPEELAEAVERGEGFLRSGDVPSARIALRRAVGAGSAEAVLLMGATFDPGYLDQYGVLGFAADAAQARTWYEQAAGLGSSEAQHRLERLSQDSRAQ